MSDLLRMTGMISGMDTESIISQLVKVKSTGVTKLKNEQKKHEWKQNAWQDLNKKIYSLYSGTLSKMRLESAYQKKSTVSSDPTKVTVTAASNADNGTQSVAVKQLAKAGYLTGAKLEQIEREETITNEDGTTSTVTKKYDITTKDKLADINSDLVGKSIKVSANGKDTTIEITDSMTVSDLVSKLKNAGLNASFDVNNQRFFMSSKKSGSSNEFSVTSDDTDTLEALGLAGAGSARVAAQDAIIELNGAEFKSETNSITVNGLTINAHAVTTEDVSVVTSTDTDGVYDQIKDFIKEYNDIIGELYKKYNADSAKDYDILSDEERESMTDEQIEEWEGKIKDSLLRRDSSVSTIMSTLKDAMTGGIEVNGKKMYLFNFGIETLSYFEAKEGERDQLHIAGDADDEKTSDKEDKLKAAIAADPDQVTAFFSSLCKKMYSELDKQMKSTDYRSMYKVYDDKRLQKEYDDYTKRIKEAEKKLNAYEDRWYDKFAAMETALAKMQSNSNAVMSMLGGN